MRFGTTLSERGLMAQPDQLSDLARHAEDLGFYGVEFGDHIIIPRKIDSTYPYTEDGGVPQWQDWLEQLTALSFLAARTTKIHLVTSVMVLPYRNPLLAAKMLASLDVLSKGRLVVGVGAGWLREEFEALGVSLFEERGSVTEEYVRMFRELWSSEKPSFEGTYYSFRGVKFYPKPPQTPHPPIWVGGESEAAMRRAAKVGDAWYPIGSNPRYPLRTRKQLKDAIRRLNEQADRAGRKSKIPVSFIAPQFRLQEGPAPDELFVGTADKVVSDIHACEELGVSYISFDFLDQDLDRTVSKLSRFADAVMSGSR